MNVSPEIIETEKQPDVLAQPVNGVSASDNAVEHLRLSEHEVDMLYYSYLRQKAIKSTTTHPPTPATTGTPSSSSGG